VAASDQSEGVSQDVVRLLQRTLACPLPGN
jgi:hypothetical protein